MAMADGAAVAFSKEESHSQESILASHLGKT